MSKTQKMTVSVNQLAVNETRKRMQKATLPDSSLSQPNDIPIGVSSDQSNDYPRSKNDRLNNFQQPNISSQTKRNHLISGDKRSTFTPWVTKEYTCDPLGLHEEICDFYKYMKPRPSEVQMRSEVILRTMTIILNRWPLAKVQVFGSFCTTLYLPTGDIDLVVHGVWGTSPLFSIKEDLKRNGVALEDSINVIDKATVPIIKFIDKLTEVRVDISFNQESGIKSVHLIKEYIQEYPFLPKIILILKQFLYQRSLNEVFYGGISSFSLTLLLVSFLQRHSRQAATKSKPNLGVLLIKFFELYGRNFNYVKTGISVLNGGHYFHKEDLEGKSGQSKSSLLYLVDPNNAPENAARGCFGFWTVKMAFDHAFCWFQNSVLTCANQVIRKDSLLSDIVTVTKEVDEYRNWVDRNWQYIPVSPTPQPFLNPMKIAPVVHTFPAAHATSYISSHPIHPGTFLPSSSKPANNINHVASGATPTRSSIPAEKFFSNPPKQGMGRPNYLVRRGC